MDKNFGKKRAKILFEAGQRSQEIGDLSKAISLYSRSLSIYPTAETFTSRGWAYSFFGYFEDAIQECKKAIKINPNFGNAYYDIGFYLLAQGKIKEAEKWLLRSKKAFKKEKSSVPFVTLGRLYASKGHLNQAKKEFENASKLNPCDMTTKAALDCLSRMIH